MRGISPFLWFDNQAEEAVNFYVAAFTAAGRVAKIRAISRYGDAGPGPKGSVMTAVIEIDGQEIMALNGGPMFHFTEAVSLMVHCDTQQEVNVLWEKLSEGGQKSRCGWLKDKFGLSWQITPVALGELLTDKDPEKAKRVMQAMMKMDKIDIDGLRRASEGKSA